MKKCPVRGSLAGGDDRRGALLSARFSQENVRATVNWERDSKREELLTDMARQLGMGLRLVEFSADSLNPGVCR